MISNSQESHEKGAIEAAKEQENAFEQMCQEQKELYKKKLKKVRRKAKRFKKKCRKLEKQNRILKEQLESYQEQAKKSKKKAKDYKRVIRRERYAIGVNPYIDLKAILKDPRCSGKKKKKKYADCLALPDGSGNTIFPYIINEQMLRAMRQLVCNGKTIDGEYRECEGE